MLPCCFTAKDIYFHVNGKSILKAALIANDVYGMIMNDAPQLDSEMICVRSFDYECFGFKTLEPSYLLKIHG
ncbi:unnamed protein product [Sphagnum troendelagicum]